MSSKGSKAEMSSKAALNGNLMAKRSNRGSSGARGASGTGSRLRPSEGQRPTGTAEFLPQIDTTTPLSESMARLRPGSGRLSSARQRQADSARGSKAMLSQTLGPMKLGGHLIADNIILDAEQKAGERPSLTLGTKRPGSRASRVQENSRLSKTTKGRDAYNTAKPSSRASQGGRIDFHGHDDTLQNIASDGLQDLDVARVVLPLQLGGPGRPGSSQLQPPVSTRRRRPESGRSKRSDREVKTMKVNAWADFDVAEFKLRHQEPSQIIEKLKRLTATDIPFMGNLPKDDELVSTDPLDSFMAAFMKIVSDRSMDFTKEVRQGIHLATGTRTEFCEHLLTFLCHHQKVEQALRDSVDFFMESLNNLVHLEQENKTMKAQIAQLLELKEGDILEKYNLQRHWDLEKRRVDEATELEKTAQAKIQQLQSILQDKIAECDSLSYRLQHFQDMNAGQHIDPTIHGGGTIPVVSRPEAGRGAVPNADADASNQRIEGMSQQTESIGAGGSQVDRSFHQRPDSTRMVNLQQENQKLAEEIENLRISLRSKDDSTHLRKIQELFNKIQIENKNLRIYNQKCETKLTSKQNVIDHLEEKNHKDMADKKEIIINLKSEIVLLKKQIETSEDTFNEKLVKQHNKLKEDYAKEYHDQIRELECRVSEKDKERKDLKKRLMKLHKDDEELSTEFTRFREQKEEQEKSRNNQFKQLEDKMKQLQFFYDEKITQLHKQIEELENQADVTKKENSILQLRQKYLMQSTETLVKQKVFLFETLTKGRRELAGNLSRMENAMLASNNNQEYLVPVKRCIREAKDMADMGQNMLINISQILSFLKIEKLHQLLTRDGELETLEKQTKEAIHEERVVGPAGEKASIMDQMASSFAPKKGISHDASNTSLGQAAGNQDLLQIQRFLNLIGAGGDVGPAPPMGDRPSPSKYTTSAPSGEQTSTGNRSISILTDNPIELACVAIKLFADLMLRLRVVTQAIDIPAELRQLLTSLSKRSDTRAESEVMQKYFAQAKKMLDQAVDQMRPIATNESADIMSTQQLHETPAFSPTAAQQALTAPSVERKDDTLADHNFSGAQTTVMRISNQKASEGQGGSGSSSSSSSKSDKHDKSSRKINTVPDEKFKEQLLQVEMLQNKLEQQKIKSKNLQLNLAGKIVVLEEQIEKMNNEKEEQIKKMELAYEEELEQAKSGVAQREQQFLQLCDEYREEIRDLQVKLEQQWKPAEESRTIKKMEQGTRGSLYKMMKEEYETLFRTNSELLKNYQTSINEFVYLREDLRGSFTLAFEIERLEKSGLQYMLNESLLKYYLSKTFQIDKSKFRFLRSEELYEKAPSEGKEVKQKSKLLRLIIEVIAEDHARVSHLFKNVKAQIKDGTSLLYDFMPLYFAMNLGSSGFSTHHNLNEFQLLSKAGQAIDGVDYVVSVLRHKQKPLIFKVIAFNLQMREEFMVELSESDIYELVEGEQQILKSLEPDRLVQKITTNLNIIERDKLRVLTCDHKIFFSEIWMKNMESHKHQQVHVQSPMESAWVAEDGQIVQPSKTLPTVYNTELPLRTRRDVNVYQPTDSSMLNNQSKLTNTAARTSQLSHLQVKNPPLPLEFLNKFNTSVGTNTDFVISDLYEGFESVYRGVQNLGEVTKMRLSILESTKTKTLLFSFDDLQSLKKLKFSLYEKEPGDQYVIHIECMKISDGHHVMISVEQIQEQGLLIRMYDLQDARSVYLALLRKQNGQYTRLADDSKLDLLMRQDFRNFIYRLSFLSNVEENEQIIHNYQFLFEAEIAKAKKSSRAAQMEAEQKRQAESLKRETIVNQIASQARALPRRKRALSAMRFTSFSLYAFKKDKFAYLRRDTDSARNMATARQTSRADTEDGQVIVDWRDQPELDKGSLLFRHVYYVRCNFDGAEMKCNESVISLYLRDRMILIEVVLFREPSQISIASQVPAQDLFAGEDPMSVPFKDRITILNKVLEKFFIISEGGLCQMKVEVNEVSIHEYMLAKQNEQQTKAKQDKGQINDDMMQNATRTDFLERKDQMIRDGEATLYQRVADIDGQMHDINIMFVKKAVPQNRTEKSGHHKVRKGQSTYGKSQHEIRQKEIEDQIEGSCAWDQLLLQVTDEDKETIVSLFNAKSLAAMLSKDEFFDRKGMLGAVDPLFLNYIQESIKVNKLKSEVYLENQQNLEKNILQKYKMNLGGKYLDRVDVELQATELKVMRKQLICNEEIQFCQYLYDVKVYELQLQQSRDIISYQIEIFAVSDPSEVYVYNYPLNFSSNVQDPHTLVIDIFNLIESPLKRYEKRGAAVSNADRKKLNKSTGLVKQEERAQGAAIDSDTVSKMNKDDIKRELFRKYIDHRLVLMIQEQRFPRRLDVMLVEPCSQLMWRNCFEPRVITSHGLPMGSMHLVDQATLEMLVAVVIDENEHSESSTTPKLFEMSANDAERSHESSQDAVVRTLERTGKFSKLKESRFVNNAVVIEDELSISLFKRKENFNICLRRPKTFNSSSAKNRDEKSESHADQSVHQSKSKDTSVDMTTDEILVIRVNPENEQFAVHKVVKLTGLNYALLMISARDSQIRVKIVHLEPEKMRTIFKFTFYEEQAFAPDDSEIERIEEIKNNKVQIFTHADIQRTITDNLRRYYGSQAMEQGLRLCDQQRQRIQAQNDTEYEALTIFEKMNEDGPSVHTMRLLQKYRDTAYQRCLVFHRKSIFDDEREKLLLLQIRLKITQAECRDELYTYDVPQAFSIVVSEPESQQEVEFVTSLDACLTPDELAGAEGELTDLRILRRLARIVLEERVDIRRSKSRQIDAVSHMDTAPQGLNIYQDNQKKSSSDQAAAFGGDEGQPFSERYEKNLSELQMGADNILDNYVVAINFGKGSQQQSIDMSEGRQGSGRIIQEPDGQEASAASTGGRTHDVGEQEPQPTSPNQQTGVVSQNRQDQSTIFEEAASNEEDPADPSRSRRDVSAPNLSLAHSEQHQDSVPASGTNQTGAEKVAIQDYQIET